jgi:hypothetical protein
MSEGKPVGDTRPCRHTRVRFTRRGVDHTGLHREVECVYCGAIAPHAMAEIKDYRKALEG